MSRSNTDSNSYSIMDELNQQQARSHNSLLFSYGSRSVEKHTNTQEQNLSYTDENPRVSLVK